MGSVIIPGQSLLCNPATAQWIKNDPELIKWLMRNGRIIPLLYEEKPSFQDLLYDLEERKSVALKWVNISSLEKIAKELDDVYSESGAKIIYVSKKSIEKYKTQLSLTFIHRIDRVHPGLGPLRKELENKIFNEINNVGVVHGTWWNTLPQREPKFFAIFDRELKEIGTIVFDFAHVYGADGQLIGHPYGRSIWALGTLTEHLTAQWSVEVEPGTSLHDDVNPVIFLRDVVRLIDLELLKSLENATENERKEYIESLNKLLRDPTEDTLIEVKIKMDEYVNKLGSRLSTTALRSYINKLRTIKRLKSSLLFWQCADFVLTSLCIGGAAIGVGEYLRQQGYVGLILTFFGAPLFPIIHKAIDKKKKRIAQEIKIQQEELNKIRPFSFVLNPRKLINH